MPIAIDALDWMPFTIPGSDRPVALAQLRADPDRAFSALVRFPPGWTRPGAGHYDAAEEVLFLEGDFAMSGRAYGAGHYGWFPAGYRRFGTASRGGALALAWFSKPNRWFPTSGAADSEADAGRVELRWQDVVPAPSPLGDGLGRLLHDGQRHSAWVVDAVPGGAAERTVQLFSLGGRAWAHVETGAPLPRLAGPVFCRVLR